MVNYIENVDVPQFFPADVVRAVQSVSPSFSSITLKNWQDPDRSKDKRPVVPMTKHDRAAAGHGRPALSTFRRIQHIAITAALTEMDIPAARASMLAMGFTDIGNGPGGWVGSGEELKIERLPGELFPGSGVATLLVAYPGEETSSIVKVTAKTTLFSLARSSKFFGATFLMINQVDQKVRTALGLSLDWAKQR